VRVPRNRRRRGATSGKSAALDLVEVKRGAKKELIVGASKSAGRLLGSIIGQSDAGASVGSTVGKFISRITGHGEYRLNHNSICEGTAPPTFTQNGKGVRICHREYITQVVSGDSGVPGVFTPFLAQSFRVNPGDPTTFPFLSGIANRFEEFCVNGLLFEYIASSGNATGANTALGEVISAFDYDANETPPDNKTELLNKLGAVEHVPSKSGLYPMECDPKLLPYQWYYISTVSNETIGQADSDDARLNDPAIFTIATMGQQTPGQVLGDLFVTYDITFRIPTADIPSFYGEGIGNTGVSTVARPMGSLNTIYTRGQIAAYAISDTVLLFTEPVEGIFVYNFSAAVTGVTFNISVPAGQDGAVTLIGNPVSYDAAAQTGSIQYFFRVAAGSTLLFNTVVGPASWNSKLYLAAYPYGSQYFPALLTTQPHRKVSKHRSRMLKGGTPYKPDPADQNQFPWLSGLANRYGRLLPRSPQALPQPASLPTKEPPGYVVV